MTSPHNDVLETDYQLNGEEIVISGISGVFPKSQSVLEFMQNLYDQVDMVSSEDARWTFNDPDIPKHMGKIAGLEKFDAQFFRVSFQLGCVLEPMARKLLEHAYGAVIDSGSNLIELKKTKVGVFIGSSFTDHSALAMYEVKKQRSDFIVNGCSKAMLANRISYWVDGKGPSYGLDYACSSSMACLEQAYKSMKAGECDAAIVGGCNYCTQPNLTVNMRRAGLLCLDGKTKCFDKNGDGYVRSDAVNLLFLQKAKDAKRIYAEVCHAKGIYKMRSGAQFLPIREPEDMQQFFEEFYAEAKVSPSKVEYIEANGAGIAEADGNELKAIERVFAKDRTVKVGCVKSNMGHSEPASGVCALTKVCLAYYQGKLPANLHFKDPQDQITGIQDGRLEIVTENQPFNRSYVALNSFSFTGANYHVLLKGHFKIKDLKRYETKIPRLVLVSGRQESSVSKILELLKSQPVDPEQISLIHNIFAYDIPGHTGRGYSILGENLNNETEVLSESVTYYPGDKRPVWFVFSGIGSQWAGMGADLMRIPVFATAIEKCAKVLKPKGVDLIKVITELDDSIFENTLHSMVGISAVQIGLTDILNEIGIVPDYIIGHSLGEMACAYHDNTFTAEELILATYIRGKMCIETSHSIGSMAAVGLSYKDIIPLCPPEIDIACHNSPESCTISGPEDLVTEFVASLTKRGIFARLVNCSGIAFHSRYIAHARPELLKGLKEILKIPKPRSSKWISTSIPKDRWNEPLAKYSSAEYHVNNILSPVLFEETMKMIPSNAIVVEIAPHSLLQAILKRSLKENIHIPLTRRGNSEGVKLLFNAIGKLYEAGLNPKIHNLYPKIEYPVSTETPLLSHFVDWVHTETWPSVKYTEVEKRTACARDIIISVEDDDFSYIAGCVRDGLNVLPEAAILVLTWQTLGMYKNTDYRQMSIVFQNICFHSETILKSDEPIRLSIAINKGSNKFEVCQDDTLVASGIISEVKEVQFHQNFDYDHINEVDDVILSTDDIYRIMCLRGFDYRDEFQSIKSMTLGHDKAFIKWTNEWVTFLDSLFQLNALARFHDGVSTPKFIKKICIAAHGENINTVEVDNIKYLSAVLDKKLCITRCAGVEIDNMRFVDKPIVEKEQDTLEVKKFVPFYTMEIVNVKTALQILLQIVAENTSKNKLTVTQLLTTSMSDILTQMSDVMSKLSSIEIKVCTINVNNSNETIQFDEQEDSLFVVENFLNSEKKIQDLSRLKEGTFVLALEISVPKQLSIIRHSFDVITSMSDGTRILILLRRHCVVQELLCIPINDDEKLSCIHMAYNAIENGKHAVLVSEGRPFCGLSGLIKKLRKNGMEKINLFVIDDSVAPRFNQQHNIYREQLRKNLSINIFRKGQWGGYYYTSYKGISPYHNVTLTSTEPGNFENLTWEETAPVSHSDILVEISYSGVSIRDAQITQGCSSESTAFGMDYSGISRNGQKIMGLLPGGSISNSVKEDPDLMWPVPEHWSLEDAATVPLPYVHAYYCLAIRCQLFEGQSVFVTGGAGALGQAVISICLSLNCTVYTSVSDVRTKEFLLKLFPELDGHNIAYSRHDTFHNMVISNSKQRGCDFVINCASGSLREAAMKCVGFCGIFMDISSYDMHENKNIGMFYLEKDRTYKAVNLSNIFKSEYGGDKKRLQGLVSEGIARGIVKPLPRVIFSPTDVSRAFRLASKSQRCRILLKMQDPSILSLGLQVKSRITYSSTGAYLVLSDINGFGIELVERLIKHGAKKIILHYKYNITGYIRMKLVLWASKDITVKINSDNLETEHDCVKLINETAKLGEVKGIFVYQDKDDSRSIVTSNTFLDDCNKFLMVVKNLDSISQTSCSELCYFVVILHPSKSDADEFSAVVTEGICQARNDLGYPALVLRVTNEFESSSILNAQNVRHIFNTLEKSLKLKYSNVIAIKKISDYNNAEKSDFLRNVAEVLGIKLDDVGEETTIQDLSLNEVNLEELINILRKQFHINYPLDKIQRFTISSLKALEKNCEREKTDYKAGLATIYNHIESEEDYLSISHPIIPMITILNNGAENDLNPNDTYLVMIPGFEDRHQIFTSIAERLKVQAVSLQLGLDMEAKTIPEFAIRARKFMKMKFETKSRFYLLGYSFGVNVALQLASILEKEGHVGVVYCLDSSPEALKLQLDNLDLDHIGNLTTSQLQNAIVEHIYQLMTGKRSDTLSKDLDKLEYWQDKVDLGVNSLKGITSSSNQYIKSILNSLYTRIVLAREFEPDFKLASELVLLKAVPDQEVDIRKLNDDYNLSKYSKQPVTVINLKSQNASASFDGEVSNIINKMLETTLLEEFRKKNLCSTYVCELN